jgi:hypothetical protein
MLCLMWVFDDYEPKEAANLVTSSNCIKWILDVMPKDLPPRRQVNHVIEVMPKVAPLAKAPY